MDRQGAARRQHVLDHAIGWTLGALLAWVGVSALGLEGPGILGSSAHLGVLSSILVGGVLGTLLVPAIRRLRTRSTNLGRSA